ncbi:MAG: DUF2934 domain-containing protein [Anaerolineae bacterium]|nr:DUF2934 domain-containing protein [Anaerolineae bacterium]
MRRRAYLLWQGRGDPAGRSLPKSRCLTSIYCL